MFITVAVAVPSVEPLTYAVPVDMEDAVELGKRVEVPLGRKRVTGYVIELLNGSDLKNVRDIIDVVDNEPLFDEKALHFYSWVAAYYLYPLGITLKHILPGGIDRKNLSWIAITPEGLACPPDRFAGRRKLILEEARKRPEGLSLKELASLFSDTAIAVQVRFLERAGMVAISEKPGRAAVSRKMETFIVGRPEIPPLSTLTERERLLFDAITAGSPPTVVLSDLKTRFPRAHTMLKSLERKEFISLRKREIYRRRPRTLDIGPTNRLLELNEDQREALTRIQESLAARRFAPILLHGVTGSGKTEVYLRAIETVLADGGGAICLVPEIALTPQLITRMGDFFDDRSIAVLHSGLSPSVKFDEWRRIRRGEPHIVIGARSAVFAPLKDIRLIIVDEEYDGSYKQENRLPYNARDLAIVRAHHESATVILGAATPDIQSFFNTQERNYLYLSLPKRVEDRPLPKVSVIDMKKEKELRGTLPVLSIPLERAMEETLSAGKQTILFLNRRGFTTFLLCRICGYVFRCRNCSVAMKHHLSSQSLRCHYCGYSIKALPLCPGCGSSSIRSYGVGTEKVAEEIESRFPTARVARLDRDAISSQASHEKILASFDGGKIDILIGTQMVAKGHDFPNVVLVGVISADTSLAMPDFRASERTFQLLTQVAGRGGRGEHPGAVIIQTFNPDHYAVIHARSHDYLGFFNEELALRRTMGYPPFSRLVNIRISGSDREAVVALAARLGLLARRLAAEPGSGVVVLGPAEAPVALMQGRHRWQILLKGPSGDRLKSIAKTMENSVAGTKASIFIDVDPLTFL